MRNADTALEKQSWSIPELEKWYASDYITNMQWKLAENNV